MEETDTASLSQAMAFCPLGVGMAVRVVVRGHSAVGRSFLVCLGEVLKMQRNQLVPPTAAGLRRWAIILFPEEQRLASKTGVYNDCVTMDSHLILFSQSFES